MTKDFEINDILSAVNSISKMKNKKGAILETKNDTFNKEDAINKNNQVKSDESEILVLSQMIEQYSINYYRKLGYLHYCGCNSEESSDIKAAAEKGWLDYESCLMESLLSLRRAGADMIFTYGAIDAATFLKR